MRKWRSILYIIYSCTYSCLTPPLRVLIMHCWLNVCTLSLVRVWSFCLLVRTCPLFNFYFALFHLQCVCVCVCVCVCAFLDWEICHGEVDLFCTAYICCLHLFIYLFSFPCPSLLFFVLYFWIHLIGLASDEYVGTLLDSAQSLLSNGTIKTQCITLIPCRKAPFFGIPRSSPTLCYSAYLHPSPFRGAGEALCATGLENGKHKLVIFHLYIYISMLFI